MLHYIQLSHYLLFSLVTKCDFETGNHNYVSYR